jgi:rhamnose utilization protein RhaD (predicted bifunctional aldolase and dehydrogenase)
MASHGMVVGGANIDDITATMHTLNSKLQSKTSTFEPKISKATRKSDFLTRGYMPCSDREVNQLAIIDELIGRLRNEWALYPDHVVFLGAEATILERNFTILELDDVLYNKPPFIFAVGEGVYESRSASPCQKSQLRCYYDVVSRLGGEEMLSAFSKLKVSELLSWDAEKYRQNSTNNQQVGA